MLLALISAACGVRSPAPEAPAEPVVVTAPALAPGRLEPAPFLGAGRRGAIVRLADGRRAIAVADDEETRLVGLDGAVLGRWPGRGRPEVLAPLDVDGDGLDELVVGRFASGETRMVLTLLRPSRPDAPTEPLDLGLTGRPQPVAALLRRPPRGSPELVVAAFDSKYHVGVYRLRHEGGAWRAERFARLRMATSLAAGDLDGAPGDELVAGRLYGDETGEPGDVRLVRDDGTTSAFGTVGGPRALAVGDVDGRGRAAIVVADGWHQEYRARARATIHLLRLEPGGGARREALAEWKGIASFSRVLTADVDGDGRAEIVTVRGLPDPGPALLLRRGRTGGWSAAALGSGEVADVAAGDLFGDGRAALVLIGPEPAIWRAER